VLADPNGPLEDTVAAKRPITVRDLLTFALGAGMVPAEPGNAGASGAAFGGYLCHMPILVPTPGEAWRSGSPVGAGSPAFCSRS
jgi:hypothetical protein